MGMTKMEYDRLVAEAFNAGSDARIAGRPLDANPYEQRGAAVHAFSSWRHGWVHADDEWASDARWETSPLPPVAGEGETRTLEFLERLYAGGGS
jgi:ribosome modulation factor